MQSITINPLIIKIVIYSLGLVMLIILIYLFVNEKSNEAYQQALNSPIKQQLCGVYQGRIFESYYVGLKRKEHAFLQFRGDNGQIVKFRYLSTIYKHSEDFKTLKQYTPTCITYAEGIILEFKH